MQQQIPASNFGYDFSMRPDCMVSMNAIVGPDSVAFDYNTKPHGHHIHSLGANSRDCCRNRVDELAFLTSDVFANKRIRGGNAIPAAILQLSRTRYQIKNGRRIVEKKKDYKSRWQNRSPDERDVLLGEIGMCYLRGFSLVSTQQQERIERAAAMSGFRGRTNTPAKFKRRIGKRLKY